MSKASFTKYDEDQFVLRLDREEAMKLLAVVGQSCGGDGDELFSSRLYCDMRAQLALGRHDFSTREYEMIDFETREKVKGYVMVKT